MPSTPTASDYIAQKQLVPSEFRTADWAPVPEWIRERAFFSAAVSQAKTLQVIYDAVQGAAGGSLGHEEARERIRRHLRDIGYTPEPGTEGTLQDLSSNKRLRVVIDHNVAMARGWQQRQELLGDIMHPAMQLYREAEAQVPRDWVERWYNAGEEVNWEGVAGGDDFIALTDSPIWVALSDFGLPYPPFAFGSHMWLRPVSRKKAQELGLEVPPPKVDGIDYPESLNEGLEADVRPLSTPIRRSLLRALKGSASIDEDGVLRYSDPNGTRPCHWKDIGEVITTELPAGQLNQQAEAFKLWVEDSSNFRAGLSKKRQVKREAGRPVEKAIVTPEIRAHMVRLINRIIPTRSEEADGGMISRALHFTKEGDLHRVLDSLRAGKYQARPGELGESWNNNELTVRRYANKKNNIILRCDKYHSRRRIDGLYPYVRVDKELTGLGIQTEGESIMPASVRYRVLRELPAKPNKLGGYDYEFELEEI